ncbi:MAG TPA: LamG domain-containing protein, partial [Puia sp.]|nr:LamG domain-containing protein [Puia sp.]
MKYFLLLLTFFSAQMARSQVDLTNGLLAYYPFNGNANDASGHGNNGFPMNGAQLTTDRFGNPNQAYYFDGIDDYISIPDHGNLSPTSVSVVAYVNSESTVFQSIIGKIEYSTGFATTYNLGINYQVQTGFYFGVTQIPGSCNMQYPYLPAYFVNSQSSFSTNAWHCVVGTFEHSNLKIYVDGALVDARTIAYSSLATCTNTDLLIGSWWSGDPAKFKGKIDDVRIYNRALNLQEVNALCSAQPTSTLCNGSLGDPVVNISFGHGSNPGPPLPSIVPGASSSLAYVAPGGDPAFPPPEDGQYSISNGVPFNQTWFFRAKDHTGTFPDGYMAIYNASAQPGEFYKQTVSGLCGGTTYEFAAWLANILNPYLVTEDLHPDVTFRIEQPDGSLLASYDTGPLVQTSYMSWQQFGLFFTTPASVSTIVLRMINNNPGGAAHQGNDLAIDDITFRPCGPTVTASLSNTQQLDSMAVCEGTSLHLHGTATAGYSNPAYIWQFSSDSGKTWVDLPNTNLLDIDVAPYANGALINYKYRMLTAESANIGSASCRVASHLLTVTVDPVPQSKLTGINTCYGDIGKMLFSTQPGLGPYSISYHNQSNTSFVQNNLNNGDTFFIPFAITDTTGFILESITDSKGCGNLAVLNNQSTINVVPLPQGSISGGSGCEGDTARIHFTASNGRAPFSLTLNDGRSTFTVNDVPQSGIIAIPNAINTSTNTYYLVSLTDSNNLGCTRLGNFTISSAVVDVLPSPKIVFDPLTPICKNDAAIMLISGVHENSGLPGNGLFRGNGVSANGTFDPVQVAPGTYSIQYYYTATNGCVDSATQPLVVNPVPVPDAGRDVLACINSSIQLSATGGDKYLWSPPTGLNDPAIP